MAVNAVLPRGLRLETEALRRPGARTGDDGLSNLQVYLHAQLHHATGWQAEVIGG